VSIVKRKRKRLLIAGFRQGQFRQIQQPLIGYSLPQATMEHLP
jgi:hypothetical protein